jgi:hypothetical protein
MTHDQIQTVRFIGTFVLLFIFGSIVFYAGYRTGRAEGRRLRG